MSVRHFDTHVVVDWSARNAPSPAAPSKDAIWIGVQRDTGPEAPRYFRTRSEAVSWLADFLSAEAGAGRKVLAGFDFPFGYPAGVARRICAAKLSSPSNWCSMVVICQLKRMAFQIRCSARAE